MHWQRAADLPACPSPAEDVAERLVLLAHYGADFSLWSGRRRLQYWQALTERVKAATFAGPRLGDWWEHLSRDLSTRPRNAAERDSLARLLSYPQARSVLRVLRTYPEVVVLRVRVIAEARRDQQNGHRDDDPAGEGAAV